jgi:cobalt-zinc-cadmium resistance protein CzcA
MRVSEMIIGVRGDVAIKIFGSDLKQLNQYASEVEALVKTVQAIKMSILFKMMESNILG